MFRKKTLCQIICLLIVGAPTILFTSCKVGPTSTESANHEKNKEAREDTSTESAGEAVERIRIKAPDGKIIANLKIKGGDVKTEIFSGPEPKILHTQQKAGNRRKIKMEGSGAIAEVTIDDNNFIVKDDNGAVLWDVKNQAGKVIISGKEGDTSPYTIESKGADEFSMMQGTTAIGQVIFDRTKGKAMVKDASGLLQYEITTTRFSSGYTVLLLSKMPEVQRYIILFELLSQVK